MKLLYTIIFMACASTCFAHGSWKPRVTPPYPTVPYAYSAGGCACTTSTDSENSCRTAKSLLSMDSLLCVKTS